MPKEFFNETIKYNAQYYHIAGFQDIDNASVLIYRFIGDDIDQEPICEIELTDEERLDVENSIRNIINNLGEYLN